MQRTRTERIRLGFLFAGMCLFFAIVVARLVHLQIILHPKYSAIVEKQTSGTIKIPAERGLVYDRYGRVVANNVWRYSMYVWAVDQQELEGVARYLEKIFRLRKGAARKEYGLEIRKFKYIERQFDDELAEQIRETAPKGLHLLKEAQRIYPYGLVGKQIVGFTDIDNKGQGGLEYAFDSLLSGKPGSAYTRRDGLQSIYRVEEKAVVKPVSGNSLVLTLDMSLQEIVERELKAGVEEHNAKGAMAAFVDCRTGDILAMAHYDPNEEMPEKPIKPRALSDQFEPGSVFKAFTAAAALDAGVVNFAESTWCELGKWKMDRGRILHDDKKHGMLTFRQIIELSSNIGTAKYALQVGGEDVYQAALNFGFGKRYNIGLGGEGAGSVYNAKKWTQGATATLAMGHAVAVNCLQMANAFGAIANGGELLKPHLVLCTIDPEQKASRRAEREVLRRVMEGTSADSLASILRGVVERGTATKVNSKAVAIAGKTGTAEIPDLKTKRYLKNKFIASFAGFFPYEKPAVAGIVVFIEPEPIHYGGYTSGPVFRKIAEQYMILNPDLFEVNNQLLVERPAQQNGTIEVPNFVGRQLTDALEAAEDREVMLRANREEGVIVWQYPPADRLMFKEDAVIVAVESPVEPGFRMADLKGLSIRQAAAFLQFAGIKCRISGRGKVINQSISPGEPAGSDVVCQLDCQPM